MARLLPHPAVLTRFITTCSMALLLATFPAAARVSATEQPPADTSTTQTSATPETSVEEPETVAEPAETQQPQPTAEPETQGSSDTGASNTGQNQPNGAESDTYTYNEATGMWENPHYTWDPNTKQTAPKSEQTYSYNPSPGMWDTTEYVYDPAAGSYVANVRSVTAPPAGGNISNPGPGSTNKLISDGGADGTFNNFYNAAISNTITSDAVSGNALLYGNTNGGNAGSGNATAMANIINMLQSTTGFTPNSLATFNANIQGDVVGDLLIDPNQLANSLNTGNATPLDNLTVNSQGNGVIQNDIALDATSGAATIANNTNAGDATTGNANAVANVVNMLNSTIGAGKSFIGAVNIHGNLDGDILLPEGFLSSVLASNKQPVTGNVTANLTNNSTIVNDVNATATSGGADVSNNTQAGNATSGDALTNMTILNLTGSNTIGKNNLLVFVNVLGQWVGVIMNAPSGTTAASLGGGITDYSQAAGNANITATNNNAILNDINVNAQSGDATVTGNTKAGNATSGDATASVNLANIMNSNISLSDWFGIVFINVFGKWQGSFGINTDAGTLPVVPTPTPSVPTATASAPGQTFRFVPANTSNMQAFRFAAVQTSSTTPPEETAPTAVLASASGASDISGSSIPQISQNERTNTWLYPAAGLILGALLLLLERYLSRRKALALQKV